MNNLNFTWHMNGHGMVSRKFEGEDVMATPPEQAHAFQSMEAFNIADLLPDYSGPIVKIVIEYMSTYLVGKGNNGWFVRRFLADGSEYNERSTGHAMRKADAVKLANASVRCNIEGNW